mgnify:CR=1 FL=1
MGSISSKSSSSLNISDKKPKSKLPLLQHRRQSLRNLAEPDFDENDLQMKQKPIDGVIMEKIGKELIEKVRNMQKSGVHNKPFKEEPSSPLPVSISANGD